MNQPKFTKGPCVIELSEIDLARITTKDTGVCLTDHANASLIAAAPDLYTACEIVLNNLVENPPEPMGYLAYKASIDALVAALKKARGES